MYSFLGRLGRGLGRDDQVAEQRRLGGRLGPCSRRRVQSWRVDSTDAHFQEGKFKPAAPFGGELIMFRIVWRCKIVRSTFRRLSLNTPNSTAISWGPSSIPLAPSEYQRVCSRPWTPCPQRHRRCASYLACFVRLNRLFGIIDMIYLFSRRRAKLPTRHTRMKR